MIHKTVRNIIHIDEEKCNGCGLCVNACAEGAIKIINGKAKLISDIYCDGLGACLGECPQGAITIEQREAAPFDEEAVKKHLSQSQPLACGCPGTMTQSFDTKPSSMQDNQPAESMLNNWPVQLALVPVTAPYLNGAKIVLSSDCAPFACADFHKKFMKGKVLLNACPKLDNPNMYIQKLSQIFSANSIKSIDIIYMEVPCCTGLIRIVKAALDTAKKEIPVNLIKLSLRGEIMEIDQL